MAATQQRSLDELELKTQRSFGEVSADSEDQHQPSKDDIDLAQLGKRPQLKRTFKFFALLGFTTTVLTTWEGNIVAFTVAYETAGPAGTIWAYTVVWVGMTLIYLCLSELSSMAPTAGGQYHWVSILSPKKYQKLLSYVTGWFTMIAWQATSASTAYNQGLTIAGLIKLCNPDFQVHSWLPTVITWAIVLFSVFINTVATSALAKFEGLILFLHILGFFAILVPLVYFAPHNSGAEVFTTFLDLGGWNNPTYSFFIGLSGSVYAFAGGDAAVHMAEEVQNAALYVPLSMLFSVMLNGILGFGMLVAILFSMGAPGSALEQSVLTTAYQFPFIQVFMNAVKSTAGAATMTSIILVLGISANVGQTATASRMIWSFARDRGIPFWRTVSRVDRRTSIPVVSVTIIAAINVLLSLIGIGSEIAFNDLLSVSIVALLASYFLPLALLFHHRLRGNIIPPYRESETKLVNVVGSDLRWGPFRIPGFLGIVTNGLALVFTIIVFIFAFWPPAADVDASSMNYACLLFGSVMIFSVAWYFVRGRRDYEGPVVEVCEEVDRGVRRGLL